MAYLLATAADRVIVSQTLRSPNSKDTAQRLADATLSSYNDYYKRIKDNHGIKEANVLSLFGPLGVPAIALGATLLPNLDNLGATRGTHAHQSAKAVQSWLDPETEYKRLLIILQDLEIFDGWLITYRRHIR